MLKWIKAWRLRRMKFKLDLLQSEVPILDAVVHTSKGEANYIYGNKLARTLLAIEKLKVVIRELEK